MKVSDLVGGREGADCVYVNERIFSIWKFYSLFMLMMGSLPWGR